LFREYVAQLVKYDKKFIIIGNMNAITYKEIFPLIKNDKMWMGYSTPTTFVIPEHYIGEIRDDKGNKIAKLGSAVWYTNLYVRKHEEDIILIDKYSSEKYPKYDNYDAIEVSKTADIPCDYFGVMGVPITFMDKFNPDQFQVIGLSQKCGFGEHSIKLYDDYKEIRQDGTPTGSTGKKTNGNPMLQGKPKSGNYYSNGVDYAHSLYSRIFIIRKQGEA
jgi:hypothetical protein